jgi:hypothetical protein
VISTGRSGGNAWEVHAASPRASSETRCIAAMCVVGCTVSVQTRGRGREEGTSAVCLPGLTESSTVGVNKTSRGTS